MNQRYISPLYGCTSHWVPVYASDHKMLRHAWKLGTSRASGGVMSQQATARTQRELLTSYYHPLPLRAEAWLELCLESWDCAARSFHVLTNRSTCRKATRNAWVIKRKERRRAARSWEELNIMLTVDKRIGIPFAWFLAARAVCLNSDQVERRTQYANSISSVIK